MATLRPVGERIQHPADRTPDVGSCERARGARHAYRHAARLVGWRRRERARRRQLLQCCVVTAVAVASVARLAGGVAAAHGRAGPHSRPHCTSEDPTTLRHPDPPLLAAERAPRDARGHRVLLHQRGGAGSSRLLAPPAHACRLCRLCARQIIGAASHLPKAGVALVESRLQHLHAGLLQVVMQQRLWVDVGPFFAGVAADGLRDGPCGDVGVGAAAQRVAQAHVLCDRAEGACDERVVDEARVHA